MAITQNGKPFVGPKAMAAKAKEEALSLAVEAAETAPSAPAQHPSPLKSEKTVALISRVDKALHEKVCAAAEKRG